MVQGAIASTDGVHWQRPYLLCLLAIAIGSLALLWRRSRPLAAAVITVLADGVLLVVPPDRNWVPMAGMVALYTLATLAERRVVWITGAAAALGLALTWVLQPGGGLTIAVLLPVDCVAFAVILGEAVRNRRAYLAQVEERAEQAERTREEEARRRVREERVRIARELHDVVAHHITLVNAQAGVAHHLLRKDPEKAYQALGHIRDTSRTALEELRATVGLLRQDDDPPPSLQPAPGFTRLDDLLDSFREADMEIRLTREGRARPLTGTADLAAYRIVQEALTNAGKHGTGAGADLRLAYTDDVLQITVANRAHPARRGAGTGHGLIGMRERAEAAGGSFHADTGPDGVFHLRATLPLSTAEGTPT
ncbi:sensor histidine kinase [Actinocorallia populi]|uniref:sensor histidine kinase n=1 Tax=Actinocorallia populi TaxID=2079200 RepID=UPI001300424A|nr:histidine kinase [Actinocorallia populi]